MRTQRDPSLHEAVKITTYGNSKRYTSFVPADIAVLSQVPKVALIIPPSSSAGRGFKRIRSTNVFGRAVNCEGAILPHKQTALIIQTADCPVVIIRNRDTGRVVATHAGRPALTPERMPDGKLWNVINIAFAKVVGDSPASRLEAHITAHICGDCFLHDHPGAEEFITPFDQFGEHVFTNRSRGALDVRAVIQHQLETLGMTREHITEDADCTKESPHLASHRNGNSTRNTIVVERIA
jgi:copper oxidase (laccase) domain-containing protein